MKFTGHEKELLTKALELVKMDFNENADSYFCMRDGEAEYYDKIDSNISEDEAEKLQMEFENKPTFYSQLVSLVNRIIE